MPDVTKKQQPVAEMTEQQLLDEVVWLRYIVGVLKLHIGLSPFWDQEIENRVRGRNGRVEVFSFGEWLDVETGRKVDAEIGRPPEDEDDE